MSWKLNVMLCCESIRDTNSLLYTACRLSLDQEDILTWGNHSQSQVLILAALSAKWSNNDAIDRAVTNAVTGGQEVRALDTTECVEVCECNLECCSGVHTQHDNAIVLLGLYICYCCTLTAWPGNRTQDTVSVGDAKIR